MKRVTGDQICNAMVTANITEINHRMFDNFSRQSPYFYKTLKSYCRKDSSLYSNIGTLVMWEDLASFVNTQLYDVILSGSIDGDLQVDENKTDIQRHELLHSLGFTQVQRMDILYKD